MRYIVSENLKDATTFDEDDFAANNILNEPTVSRLYDGFEIKTGQFVAPSKGENIEGYD